MGRARTALGFLALLAACGGPAPAERPAVLLVVLDTVRADRTSTYGYHRRTTIQLDAVADAGVVFEDVTAPGSWTWPSHASLFTGEPPWVHGAHMAMPRDAGSLRFAGYAVSPMRPDLPTLAERFRDAGYRTVSLVVNAWIGPELGLARGFEETRVFGSDAQVIRAAEEAIRGGDGRPLFLFLNFVSAHGPYENGPGPWGVDDPALLSADTAPAWVRPYLTTGSRPGVYLSRFPEEGRPNGVTRHAMGELAIPPEGFALMSTLYDAGVRGADYSLGRVLSVWSERHPAGVVAATSDHGEALGEHGLLQHKASVYPEVLRVPLVLAAPGLLPAGVRVDTPVQIQDLYPTLLELAGIDALPRSLVPVARGEERHGPITAAAWPDPVWATHAGGRYEKTWRLYRTGDRALVFADDGEAQLFDVAADPGMLDDLAPREPAGTAAILEEARAYFGKAPPPAAETLEIPAATLERLRHLGYAAE